MKDLFRWLLILPLSIFLFAALFYGNGEKIHARLLVLGESLFTGYFALQSDQKAPDCDIKIDPPSDQNQGALEKPNAPKDELDDLIDSADPKTDEAKAAPKDDLDALIDGDDSQADQKNQPSAQALEKARQQSLAAAQQLCDEKKAQYIANQTKITPTLKAFRSIEKGVGYFVSWMVDHFKHILVLIMLLGTLTASLKGHHIALDRPGAPCRSGRYASSCVPCSNGGR